MYTLLLYFYTMQKELFKYLDAIITLQQQLLEVLLGRTQTAIAEEWLDNTDVKQLLKISDRTLYRLRSSGQLPAKKIGGKWYYPRKALVRNFNIF